MKHWCFLLAIAYPAFPQVQHGSVGVVFFSPEKIIMAADSRQGFSSGGPPHDDYCKIAALGGEILFVSTGSIGFDSVVPLIPSWDNANEARAAYRRSRGHQELRGPTVDVAVEWADTLRGYWTLLLARDPVMVSRMAENSVITVAYFGGPDVNGSPQLIRVQIILTSMVSGSTIDWVVRSVSCAMNFCAAGRTDVFSEFVGLASERAKDDFRTWSPNDDDETAPQYYDIKRTMRFVELTIQFQQGTDVGGPVDAVQLKRDGTLEWYARKQNCQEK